MSIYKIKIIPKGKSNDEILIKTKQKLDNTNKICRKRNDSNLYNEIIYNSFLIKVKEKFKTISLGKTHKNINFKNKNFSTKLNILGANKKGIINIFRINKFNIFKKEFTQRNSFKDNYFEKILKIKNYNHYSIKNINKYSNNIENIKNENYKCINNKIYVNDIKLYKKILLKDKNKNKKFNEDKKKYKYKF